MKTLFKLLTVAALLFAAAIPARAQTTNTNYTGNYFSKSYQYAMTTISTGAVTVVTNTTSAPLGKSVVCWPNRGFSLFVTLTSANGGTGNSVSNVVINLAPSVDGTNYAHTNFISFAVRPMAGTNSFITYTNVPASMLDNVRYFRLTNYVNSMSNSVIVNSVQVGQWF